jgi:hypothetical protein
MIVADNCKSIEIVASDRIDSRCSQKGIAKLNQALAEFNSLNSYWDRLHEDNAIEFQRAQFNPSMKTAVESKLTRGNKIEF